MSVPLALPAGFSLGASGAPLAPSKGPVWNIVELGAVGDGKTNNRKIIQAALDAAAGAGGGKVYIPPGTFMTGSLTIGSNTTLHLETGAVLLGSPSPDDYTLSSSARGSGKHLLFAKEAHNVCIDGNGTIDGNAVAFRERSQGAPFEPDKRWLEVVIFDWKSVTWMSTMLHFTGCRNLILRDITVRESPRWTIAIDACNTVTVEGIKIRNVNFVPETDGIDIVCSQNVIIRGCDIATADDAICLKSEGANHQAYPTRNVLVTGCLLTGCCNGFKIGTGSKSTIENVQFTDSIVYNTEPAVRERLIGALCIEMVDGGVLDGVRISGIQIQNARTPLFIRLGQRSGNPGTLRNVSIENVHATGAISASSITGIPNSIVQNVSLRHFTVHSEEGGDESWSRKAVPELEGHYPEALMFERLPAFGLYVRHAQGLRLDGVELIAEKPDGRPAMIFDDVQDVEIASLKATPPHSGQPVVALHNCQGAFLHGLQARPGTGTFLSVTGPASNRIRLTGNDLSDAAEGIRAEAMSQVKVL